MTEADAEDGNVVELAEDVGADPDASRVGGIAGPRRENDVRRTEPSYVVDGDLVIAMNDGISAERADELHEVPRERVVVVDDERGHGVRSTYVVGRRAVRARESTAAMASATAFALRSASACSAAG